jgi:maltose alpha-D-glucosyltransferase/alpha-amylase
MLITEASDALEELAAKLREMESSLIGRPMLRIHGDMHLYQILVAGDRLVLTDFEGEPFKSPASPLEKEPPERDLAGLARSLDYVAVMATMYSKGIGAEEASYNLPHIIGAWEVENFSSMLDSYLAEVSEEAIEPMDSFRRSLLFWIVERASYEAVYEMRAGTGLHHIPLNALLRINEGKDPIFEWLEEG